MQPVTTTICPGCTGDFSVTATHADLYQWQYWDGISWVNVTDTGIYSGSTTANLTLSNPTPANNGTQYRVLLNNAAYTCGEQISDTVILNIQVASIITNRRITYRVNKN